ncbi:hypothetical protein [Leptospira idonii]|uniref:Uncharacterized protein n=1 Tax=Leptospira idonii TaxID=1193500 RepID=A0A4R9LYY5_9LEPT|nr:hypothetical protein [Leptospira idonii]TGN19550.1 hypothetical protein EHS15_07105 [Leptospira idonii]
MKSDIDWACAAKKAALIYKILIFLFLLFPYNCSSTGDSKSKLKSSEETSTQIAPTKQIPEEPKKLRITYDAVWSPKDPFVIIESGNLHESGVTYLIRYTEKTGINQSIQNSEDPLWVRISSTNQDNQRVFPYLQNTSTGEVKITYFQWKGRRSAVQTKILPKGNVYCRWEGIYNGFLLVVETEFLLKEGDGENSIPPAMHKHVTQNLELF